MLLLYEISLAIDTGLLVLIWIVQAILYPSFKSIDAYRFKEWHSSYTKMMGYIAAPLMISQLALTSLIFLQNTSGPVATVHFALVVSLWASTFLLSVPIHKTLQDHGKDINAISRLIFTNWIRTAGWTIIFGLSLSRVITQ